MPIFTVTYEYADRPADLDATRPEHREFLRGLHAAGTLVASGPWLPAPDATPGALLLLAVDSAENAEGALDEDPFARASLIARRSVRGWSPVIGDLTAHV
ncbi:hypothetical protein GCM10025865_28560 [Paraoerskovia sediminicola]|uniref:YCII-related domain-containing protein n=1 Tax=Paraoerskovia sediminicola TaxID=1138587 RepID=A0ABN6XFA0_9CELL|nr:YciI family protein [Paraoerskovia sediminicola]BDZ43557.1 hypothetical protein GCM10025865_28560 [Paraoerskovia sediminicola]